MSEAVGSGDGVDSSAFMLIVEPARTFRSLLRATLKGHSFATRFASSVGEALGIVEGEVPRVILTSLELPGLSAVSLVAALKASPRHRAIPICVLTADRACESIPGHYQADAILHKTPELMGRISDYLAGIGLAASSASDAETPLRGRILLAEDVRTNQILLSRILHVAGASVTVVENGMEAISTATSSDHDLILMDIEMPEMDGLTATKVLRRMKIDIPILALTGHEPEQVRERALESGLDDVLRKNMNRQKLIEACQGYLNR